MNAVKIGDTPELTPDGLCLNSSLEVPSERCALLCGSTKVVWPLADMVTVSPKVKGGDFWWTTCQLLKGSPCCLHEGMQACLSYLKGLLKDTAKQNTIAAPSHCRRLSGSGMMQECIFVDAGKLKVLPAVNMTPVMAVRVRTVQMSAVLRVSLSPVLDDLPFIGGVALSFMTQPYLDFDLRYLAQQLPNH